jgi:hypothetical protein
MELKQKKKKKIRFIQKMKSNYYLQSNRSVDCGERVVSESERKMILLE